jgi:hypothetical protein
MYRFILYKLELHPPWSEAERCGKRTMLWKVRSAGTYRISSRANRTQWYGLPVLLQVLDQLVGGLIIRLEYLVAAKRSRVDAADRSAGVLLRVAHDRHLTQRFLVFARHELYIHLHFCSAGVAAKHGAQFARLFRLCDDDLKLQVAAFWPHFSENFRGHELLLKGGLEFIKADHRRRTGNGNLHGLKHGDTG